MLPILCYHKIDTRFELGFTRLGPRVFRRQVEGLARAGWSGVGTNELFHSPPSLPSHSSHLLVTFDDGYEGLDRHALPVIADHAWRAVVFVITDYVGRDNRWDVRYGWRTFRHLDWDQLGRWQERGIEVHSHTATHARLTWASDDEAADELGRSREAIASRLGAAPAGISYPFGAMDSRVRRLALAAGYRLGFAGPGGYTGGAHPDDLMALRRLGVYAWDRFAVPAILSDGPLGRLARGSALVSNRISLVTTLLKKLSR